MYAVDSRRELAFLQMSGDRQPFEPHPLFSSRLRSSGLASSRLLTIGLASSRLPTIGLVSSGLVSNAFASTPLVSGQRRHTLHHLAQLERGRSGAVVALDSRPGLGFCDELPQLAEQEARRRAPGVELLDAPQPLEDPLRFVHRATVSAKV
jgi:hypothetical protein